MDSMIKGFWQATTLVCGNHADGDKEIVMALQQGSLSVFYACPMYHAENRAEDDCMCANRISLKEFEGMLNHLFTVLERADENSTVLNLTNYTWKKRGIEFKVLEYTPQNVKVSVLNIKEAAKT